MTVNNSINNTLQTPFNVGATSVTSTGAQLNLLNALSTFTPITKVNVQTISATGAYTYTPTSGTQYAIFRLQAGGGGSGGTTGTAGQSACSGAGGGGAYMEVLVSGSANLAAITGSVGIAGTAGNSGNNPGGSGGNTTLIINSGSTWTASGGGAGTGQAESATVQNSAASGAGGTNTTGTNGTLMVSIPGSVGGRGFTGGAGITPSVWPIGGGSHLSPPQLGNSAAGLSWGGGGSGSLNAVGSNNTGFAGVQGVVLVTEFISA